MRLIRLWPAFVGMSILLQWSPSWALSYDWIIRYQGITYESWDERGWNGAEGRPLTEADLDRLVTLVECDMTAGDSSRDPRCGYELALGGPRYTELWSVKGYRTDFRLAAKYWGRGITLYQARENPTARTGAALFDLTHARVRSVAVARQGRRHAVEGPVVETRAREVVDGLLDMLLAAPVRPMSPATGPLSQRFVYYVSFRLSDGTVLCRRFEPETGQLMWNVALPPQFWETLLRLGREAGVDLGGSPSPARAEASARAAAAGG